nr:hypothetical protein [Tanacetum cinerariifolium]
MSHQVFLVVITYPDVHPPSQEKSDEVFQANHSVQYKKNLENSSNSNQEKEEPPQDSDIRQLIREECSVKVCEEQKRSLEDTMLELVKICQEKEFLCIYDDVDDLIESALNSKLLLINSNSQHLDKKEQEDKNVIEQPAERGNRKPEHLLSMRYEHLSITLETESDEVTESNAENLLPIPNKCEVTLEDKKECDLPISENSLVCDNHSDIFFDSKIDDDISVYDDDLKISSTLKRGILDDSTNDPLLEEADLFLAADHSIPPGEEIPVVMNDKDEDVYSSFIFVIFAKMFSLLSAESEDTIFDPGISD